MTYYYVIISILIIIFIILILYVKYSKDSFIYTSPIVLKGTNGKNLIPKSIYQLVKDKNNINEKIKKSMLNLRSMNPNWNYVLLDNNDIDLYLTKYHPGRIQDAYNKINPEYGAGKSDLFRYVLMYDKGGVYLDDKSSTSISLDDIIKEDDEYILSHWISKDWNDLIGNEFGEFQQWHIICRPQHPYLKDVINKVISNINNYDYFRDGYGKSLLHVTGPIPYTTAILPILDLHYHRIAREHTNIHLIYNDNEHRSLSKSTHYTDLTSPIIL